MVLQRDLAIPIWGTAGPGEAVTVTLADRQARATADPQGAWKVSLGPFPAGGPHELTVSNGRTITVRDVLVGDVYLCSGQSNMEWTVGASRDAAAEMARANYPGLRHFAVPKAVQARPLGDLAGGEWQECRPQTVGSWTAVGYYFGRELHEALKIPIGLIHSSWGGTVCEAWTSAEALRTMPDFKAAVESIEATVDQLPRLEKEYARKVAAWEKALQEMDAGRGKEGKPGWEDPATDVSAWKQMELPTIWENAGLPDFDGIVWFRKDVIIPVTWTGKELTLSLGPIDDMDVTFWNGRRVGAIETAGQWQTPRVYKIPGEVVQPGKNALVVKVTDTGGAGGIYGKPEQMKLQGPGPAIALAGPWSYSIGLDFSKVPPKPPPPAFSAGNPNSPTALFNGMIAPLIPYGLKGAIWYQGESNVGRARQYQTLFPTMIRDWRSRWGVGEFPFLFVQLANFMKPRDEPGESAWAELQEAQLRSLSVPHTGMAVICDIGDAADIHPRNKQDVGRRLAQWALATTYGRPIVPSGPLYRSMSVEGGRVRIRFGNVGGGLVAKGGDLRHFAISGQDKKWVWAEAKIDGDTVVVFSEKVPQPAAVRYAWADNPEGCNLYNREGLPASPFRTDP
jgi:sialate O-acetylesterase